MCTAAVTVVCFGVLQLMCSYVPLWKCLSLSACSVTALHLGGDLFFFFNLHVIFMTSYGVHEQICAFHPFFFFIFNEVVTEG